MLEKHEVDSDWDGLTFGLLFMWGLILNPLHTKTLEQNAIKDLQIFGVGDKNYEVGLRWSWARNQIDNLGF